MKEFILISIVNKIYSPVIDGSVTTPHDYELFKPFFDALAADCEKRTIARFDLSRNAGL